MNTTVDSIRRDTKSIEESAFYSHPIPTLIVDRHDESTLLNDTAKKLLSQHGCSITQNQIGLTDIGSFDKTRLMQDIIAGASTGFLIIPLTDNNTEKCERLRFTVTPLKSAPRQVDKFLLTFNPLAQFSQSFVLLNKALEDANTKAAIERRLYRELEKNYARLNTFSTIAAHDLKAPVRNIAQLLEFIDSDYGHILAKDGTEMLREARQAALRMQKLIVDLLQHAKASSNNLNFQTVDLHSTIDQVKQNLGSILKTSNGLIEIDCEKGQIIADPLLFHQLLENIVGNAIKYCSPVRKPLIQITSRIISDSKWQICVQDNGIGFDNKYKDQVFHPFTRIPTHSAIEGTGIGLATCKSICDHHGWELYCDAQLDAGAKFTIQGNIKTEIA